MVLQGGEGFVGLGQGGGLFPRGRANLGGDVHPTLPQQGTELVGGHQHGLHLLSDVVVVQAKDVQVLGQAHQHGVFAGTLGLETAF